MAVDPLWEEYRGLSSYHYAANNPLILIDPTGLGTYFSNGEFFAYDGVDDGKQYLVPDDIWQEEDIYTPGTEGLAINFSVLQNISFLYPGSGVRQSIITNIMDNESIMSPHLPNTEGGGVVASSETNENKFEPNTWSYTHGGSQTVSPSYKRRGEATIPINKAINEVGLGKVVYTVHSHGWSMNGNPLQPSKQDWDEAYRIKIDGILINNQGVIFYRNNGEGARIKATVPLEFFKK